MKGGPQMTKDKKVLYSISILIFAVLLAAFFIDIENSKLVTACLLLPMAIITRLFVRKRSSVSINKKEVLFLSAIIGVIYVVIVQMLEIFFGSYKNPYFVTPKSFLTILLPIATIIVASELLRNTLLAQKNAFASFFAFLSCVLADVLAFSNLAGIKNFNLFMDMVGMTLFPAISANIYYHYASRRFGTLPNVVFRCITTLYLYFMKTVSAIPNALFACIKIFLPIVMLALVAALFEKKKKNALQKSSKLSAVGLTAAVLVILSVSMLISCQFRFGAIVIATESMTGEINKGDMIIYERYDDQTIKEGQVIVFLQNKNRIIHRVVKIEHVGNETRYYTKGDANNDIDAGYRTDTDIVGLTNVKVAYIGFPTLWLRELLKSSN